MSRHGLTNFLLALIFFIVPILPGAALAGGASVQLEQQVQELVRQNRVLMERLGQVEAELASMKAEAKAEAQQVAGAGEAEEPSWYDRIEIGVSGTGIVQGASYDGNTKGRKDSHTHASYSADIEVGAGIAENGQAFMLIETGDGNGVDQDFGTFGGFNGDALGDQDLKVSELWYEHALMNELLRLRVGKVDITTDFDTNNVANDETTQFLAGQFINNLAMEMPDPGFGAMLWVNPTDFLAFGLGYADADADWDDVFDDAFGVAEADFILDIGGLQGTYRAYGWTNAQDHASWDGDDDETGYGFGLSCDQQILDSLTLFARYGYADDDIVDYAVEHAVSAGLEVGGRLWGRADDVLGLAWGIGILNSDYEDDLEAGGTDADDEHQMECYYRFQMNEHLAITPDFQYVVNPEGIDDEDDIYVLGVRSQLSF